MPAPTPAQIENRRRFVAALRDPQYFQTTSVYRKVDSDPYKVCCALGIAMIALTDAQWIPAETAGVLTPIDKDGANYPAHELTDILGIQHEDIVDWNDYERWTFTEIADHIERNIDRHEVDFAREEE